MYFADEGEGNGFGEFIWLLLEKIRKSITKTGETKAIMVSTRDGVPHYERQGCQRIKWSLCSEWVKKKLELEGHRTNHVDSDEDNVMVLNNGQLRLSTQNFETLFKRFVVDEKTRMGTGLSKDLDIVPERFRHSHWTKTFRKIIDESNVEPLSEFRRNEIAKMLIEAYEKDKNNIYFDQIVKNDLNNRSIIKIRNVLKLVEYPTLTRGAEAKEMNALENYLLSHVEVYHDAFSEPDVQSLLFCKLCNSRINMNYKFF